MFGWDDALVLGTVGAAQSGVNSALGVGSSFLSDWFGDNNRQDQANTDFSNYVRKSGLDWQFYHDFYAPFNQQLQKEMFDYTSAGNLKNSEEYFDYTYDANIKSIGDSLAAKKQALIDNGYNPILAVNGGLSAVGTSGSTIGSSGQLGALGSPHSASGVSTSGGMPNSKIGGFSLGEILGAANSAAMADKTEAEAKNIKARTSAILKMSELDEAKAALEFQSLFKEVFPGSDVTPIDDKGAQDFVRALRNKYQRDAYLNSIERQAVLDSVGVGTDALNSAAGFKRAFKPVKSR